MKLWSTKEAARRLGISEGRVRQLLKQGRIKGKKLNGTWVVTELYYKRQRKYEGKKAVRGKSL